MNLLATNTFINQIFLLLYTYSYISNSDTITDYSGTSALLNQRSAHTITEQPCRTSKSTNHTPPPPQTPTPTLVAAVQETTSKPPQPAPPPSHTVLPPYSPMAYQPQAPPNTQSSRLVVAERGISIRRRRRRCMILMRN